MSDTDLPPLRWALRERQEEVARRLQDAFVAGYLEDDELDLRLERAQAAADMADLDRVLEGLPAPYRSALPGTPSLPSDALVRVENPAPPTPEGALVPIPRTTQLMIRIIGDGKRTLVIGECPSLKCLSVIGDTRIRLKAPEVIPGGVTHITFFNVIGDVRVDVPPGVRVVNESVALIGDLENPATDDPTHVHTVVLRGLSLIGDVEIRVREG